MLNFGVKINISSGNVTEFLARNTNLDLKALIPKAVTDYIRGDICEKLVKGTPEICNRKEKIPTYITVYFDVSSSRVVDFLNNIDDKKKSTICRNIFEVKFISEHFDFLAKNRCFIPNEIEKKAEVTFADVIESVCKGDNFRTTVGGLLKICNQQKRTRAFSEKLFSRIYNAGACITTLDNNAIYEELFKTIDKETEIIICIADYTKVPVDADTPVVCDDF